MKKTLRSLVLLLTLVAWVGNGLAQEVTLDFTNNSVWKFPTSSGSATASDTFSNGTYSVTASDKVYFNSQGKYLMVTGGKTITLPAFNFDVEKIVVSTTTGMSKTATSNILVDGKVASTEIKGVGPLTFSISNDYQASGNTYVFKATNNKNVQVTKIEVYKKASNKTATTLSFPNAEINIEEGNEASFAAQTATLTSNGSELTGKTITYKATGDAIFDTFNESTGAATLKVGSFGTATVTATFAGDDTYATSMKSYKVNYTEKQKTATTLTFVDTPTTPKNIGDEFQLHTSLTAGDAIVDADVTFDSSDKTVATIDADGNVKTLGMGKTTITATFAGNDTYANSEASFILTVADPNIVAFIASEDNGSFNTLSTYPSDQNMHDIIFTDFIGKEYSFQYAQCMKNNGLIQMRAYGNDKGTGQIKSPVFDKFPNGYKVTVYYGISNNKTPLTITSDEVSSAISSNFEEDVKITTSGKGYYSVIELPKSTATFTITSGGNATYVREIVITPLSSTLSTLTLSETDADVETTIAENDGKIVNVKLQRTLKANVWNTICLPFAVSADDVKNVLKAEGNVREYEGEDGATATINFKDATALEAGVPYLIKPTEDATELNFEAVTIKNVEDVERMVGGKYCIMGIFAPYAINTNGTDLFLLASGKFAVPAVGKNKMNGFRAYFNVPSGTSAANVNINFGDATGISGVEADAVKSAKVYNLNGQYVGTSLDALPGGIYVVNGKKVMK